MIINEKYFRKDHTGMSMYDDMISNSKYYSEIKNMKAKVVHMSPESYIKRAAKILGRSYDQVYQSRNYDRNVIEDLKTKMEKGVELYTPVLNYKDNAQEGIHRAIAAIELGITIIPVIEVDRAYPKGQFHVPLIYDSKGNVKEYTNKWK